MSFSFRRLVTVVLPVSIFLFIVMVMIAKLILGLSDQENPVITAKLKKIQPVLISILDENRNRFERYGSNIFKGVPSLTVFDYTQLNIDYTLEQPLPDPQKQRKITEDQFQRLLCRNKSFVDLYTLQVRLSEESDDTLYTAINIGVYQPDGKTLLWKIAITPESCQKTLH